jgi:hypothetical protein
VADASGTWHHGLIARWWAELNTAEPEEVGFRGVTIQVGYTGQPATANDGTVAFVARK